MKFVPVKGRRAAAWTRVWARSPRVAGVSDCFLYVLKGQVHLVACGRQREDRHQGDQNQDQRQFDHPLALASSYLPGPLFHIHGQAPSFRAGAPSTSNNVPAGSLCLAENLTVLAVSGCRPPRDCSCKRGLGLRYGPQRMPDPGILISQLTKDYGGGRGPFQLDLLVERRDTSHPGLRWSCRCSRPLDWRQRPASKPRFSLPAAEGQGGGFLSQWAPVKRYEPNAAGCIMTVMGKRAQRKRAERDKQKIRLLPDMPNNEGVTGSVGTVEYGGDRTSLDEAQELIYEAFESDGPTRVKLARRALAISADCADAYTMLAEQTARTYAEKRALYAAGVAAGERALGPEAFGQDVGAFWGLIETRPYMRARAGLATCLWHLGERIEAVEHFRGLLRLNPQDNQGIRFTLVSCLMALGRDAEAQSLVDHPEYVDDASASWAYARALLAFRREGAGPRSRQILAEALAINRFVPAYLTGEKPLPRRMPSMIGPGEASEAVECAAEQFEPWGRTAGAVGWLRAATSQGRGPRSQPMRRVTVISRSRRDVAAGRRWLFPPVIGSFDGIELAFLDPANPDDRQLLIEAEHPDFHRVIEEGHDEVEVEGSVVNPRLHLAYHEAVANQLWDGTPPEAWPTVERLRRLGYGRHDILHMLGSVLTEQLSEALRKREPNDPTKYARALAALPESWQQQD